MRILPGNGRPIYTLAYSPDGRLLAAGDAEGVALWDLAAGRVFEHIPPHREPVEFIAPRASKPETFFRTFPIKCVRFSPDGAFLALGYANNIVRFHRLKADVQLPQMEPPYGTIIQGLDFSPDGKHLVVVDGSQVTQYETARPSAQAEYGNRPTWAEARTVHVVRYSPDSATLAVGSGTWGRHSRVRLDFLNCPWQESQFFFADEDQRGPVLALAFSPNSKTLAAGSSDHSICLYDVASGAIKGWLEGHTDAIRGLAFAPDGRTLTSVSWDGTVKVWDVRSRRERTTFTWHTGMVHAVAFAPDGMTAATAGQDGSIVIWDVDL